MALSRVVSEILIVEKYRDLEILVKGQARSLKVVSFDRLYGFLLVLYSNFVPVLRYATCKYDLETRVTGHSGLLKMSTIDRAYINDFLLTFYCNYGSISCR